MTLDGETVRKNLCVVAEEDGKQTGLAQVAMGGDRAA